MYVFRGMTKEGMNVRLVLVCTLSTRKIVKRMQHCRVYTSHRPKRVLYLHACNLQHSVFVQILSRYAT